MAVSGPRGNTFTLTVPSPLPNASTSVTLAVSAKASSAAGGKTASSKITVTYGGFGCVTYYPLPSSSAQPNGITAGPDGNVWFTEGTVSGNGKVGRIEPSSGAITEFSAGLPTSDYYGIISGPNDSLWFAGYDCGCLGSITTSGTISTVAIDAFKWGGRLYSPSLVGVAQNGSSVWFTNSATNSVGWYNPSSNAQQQIGLAYGQSGTYYVNTPDWSIVTGPDGALWTVGEDLSEVDRVSPIDGSYKTIMLQSGGTGYTANAITSGPDGNLWIGGSVSLSSGYTAFVGRLSTSGASFTPYLVDAGSPYEPESASAITTGSDGNLYFLEELNGRITDIGKATTSGTVTIYPVPADSHGPGGYGGGEFSSITYGSDGNLWFTDCVGGSIGRFTLH